MLRTSAMDGRADPSSRVEATLQGRRLLVARGLWIAIALAGVVTWAFDLPVYYHSALVFSNANCCMTRLPEEWRDGLTALGLSPTFYAAYTTVVMAVIGWVMAAIAVLIFVRRSDEWIALFISLTMLGLGMTATNNDLAALQQAYGAWGWAVAAYGQLPYYAFFLIPMLFPDGRFVPRWTVAAAVLVALLAVLDVLSEVVSLPSSPASTAVSVLILLVVLGAVLVGPIYRYARISTPAQREQTKWVVFALVIAIAVFALAGLLGNAGFWARLPPAGSVLYDLGSITVTGCGFAFVAVAFAIAILRYRLWDIDLIINRAVVYVALTVSIVALYVLIVGGAGQLLQGRFDLLLSLLATGVAAVLFQPLRLVLQRGVNRLLYGRRDEPYAVISSLGDRLQGTLAPEAVLPTIVQTVADALRLPFTGIELRGDGGPGPSAAAGTLNGEPERIPLLHQGERVGDLVLGHRLGESAFSAADRRLLRDLAQQAGAAARTVLLVADLRRSREALVTAREEERRRLRRDLHDGLGPALASMAMRSELARETLVEDPARADPLLGDLTRELQEATAEIRRLAHELRPPALDDLGLVEAVRSQLLRFDSSRTRMVLEAPDSIPPLPAAVEVAAFRIILEAVHNVVRHAGASSCRVAISIDPATQVLGVEVRDDGIGLASAGRPGVGLSSMRERAEELEGTCRIEQPANGGTRIVVEIPLALRTHSGPAAGEAGR